MIVRVGFCRHARELLTASALPPALAPARQNRLLGDAGGGGSVIIRPVASPVASPGARPPDGRILRRITDPHAMSNTATVAAATENQPALEREIAGLVVEALNLDVAPDEIAPDAPLYGEGLGLDSIDILEIALVVSKTYGFQLRSDDENNTKIFSSLASLAAHVAAHRTK